MTEDDEIEKLKTVFLMILVMLMLCMGYFFYSKIPSLQLNTVTQENLPELHQVINDNQSHNQNSLPHVKDLTLPSGFHHLKWGDGIEKLNHPQLVTDNDNNFEVAGYVVDAQMREVPQCYIQSGENLKLGMSKISEIVYCFTNKQLSQVQVYRKVAYVKGYNEDNCDSFDCIANRDQTLNSLFVDYITKTYGTTANHQDEAYQMVEPKTWQDSSGKNIVLIMNNIDFFTIGTDYYDNQSAQKIAMAMDKCNRSSAEGNAD